jgi:hypothetical protein
VVDRPERSGRPHPGRSHFARSWNRIRTSIPYLLGVAVLVAALVGYAIDSALSGPSTATKTSRTLHYAPNVRGSVADAAGLGFDLFDVHGSTSHPAVVNRAVDSLPPGEKALVWVGNLDNAPPGSPCPAPGFTNGQFRAQVDALRRNPRVYGYYVADEPHPTVCPRAAADIKARADYIHAEAPGQSAFIVVAGGSICGADPGCEYRALQPSRTHVDLVGLDPYPCHYDSEGDPVPCDDSMIAARVLAATANGIPSGSIVPVFQAFGQARRTDGKSVYYRMPSAGELAFMLSVWHSLVPAPAFDYFYTFGVQCNVTSCPAPQAIIDSPELRGVVRSHNER